MFRGSVSAAKSRVFGGKIVRYQVFISSTYIDLVEERSAIVDSVLKLDCFPAGMELFPAANEEQFEYIKSKIDESDYYVLVIGGRYGSVDDDGISYTEKEYDYAVATKKPILVFIHSAPMALPTDKFELDEAKRDKLEQFREKAKHNRLIKYWKTSGELSTEVVLSLTAAFKDDPQKGWVRQVASDNQQLEKELTQYKSELEGLKNKYIALMTKYQQVLELRAENEQSAVDIGFSAVAAYIVGNYAKAVELYSKAIRLEPNKADFYNNRGVSLHNLSRYDEALRDYNKAIELQPDDAEYYDSRATTLSEMGRYDDAQEDENKVRKLRWDEFARKYGG